MKTRLSLTIMILTTLLACTDQTVQAAPGNVKPREGDQLAVFAGGCFWCMETPFEDRPGVRAVISGYTGGDEKNPTYEQVSAGKTGHTEAVQVIFDPKLITYAQLLKIYWQTFDPTDAGGQFNDRGSQYRPGIFVLNDEQRAAAEASKAELEASGTFKKPIVVEITDFKAFWPAEAYHQDYYRTHAADYKSYRKGSGRVDYLVNLWGEDAGWGHPKIEGVPDPGATPQATPVEEQPTPQPTSRPTDSE